MYNKGLFHSWVPGLLYLLLIMLLTAVTLLIKPINAANISLMASSTGVPLEYYMWGNYATIIGFSIVLPFIWRNKTRFRSKELLIVSFVVMAIMSVVVTQATIGENRCCCLSYFRYRQHGGNGRNAVAHHGYSQSRKR